MEKPLAVSVVLPKRENLETSIKSKGRFYENNVKTVYLPLGSRVTEIDVRAGEFVERGRTLLSYEKPSSALMLDPDIKNGAGFPTFTPEDLVAVFQSGTLPSLPQIPDSFSSGEVFLEEEPESGTVESPITGIVTKISAAPGDVSSPAIGVVTVSDFSDMRIKTDINEALISDIRVGQRVRITGDSLKNRVIYGFVSEISPVAKQTLSISYPETVIEVTILPDGDVSAFRPGISLEISIITRLKEHVLTIPYEAITQDEKNYEIVYVVKNGRAEKRYIVTGLEGDESIEVLHGISNGEEVILNPGRNLKDLQRVSISE